MLNAINHGELLALDGDRLAFQNALVSWYWVRWRAYPSPYGRWPLWFFSLPATGTFRSSITCHPELMLIWLLRAVSAAMLSQMHERYPSSLA